MEEKVKLCGVKLSSSYEMSLAIIKTEFETESLLKGYHAYMNDWTPILGQNVSTRTEPENDFDKYIVVITKDAQVVGRLKKGKTGRYAKPVFTSSELIQWTLLVLLFQGKGLTLEMDKACKFSAQFYSTEKKNTLKF